MKQGMPYDCIGRDGQDNKRAWDRLPPCVRFSIRMWQQIIQAEVDKKNPLSYRPTSGFRSQSTNDRWSGAKESGHRIGYCRDFVAVSPDNNNPPVVDNSRFRVIRSNGGVWHVEITV